MDEKKPCPACGEMVREQARFCAFCEHEFVTPSWEPAPEAVPQALLHRLGIFLMIVGILVVAVATVRLFF